jgi:ABC-type arginine transport system ATPase subunit
LLTVDKKDPLLQIDHLTVHYGAAQALFGIDLAVGRGETVALVGGHLPRAGSACLRFAPKAAPV